MKNSLDKAFTLVELLVVITILAIISVVAYQNFGGAVDKAVSGRKIADVSTIETSLQQYKVDNNYYPPVNVLDTTSDKWAYDSTTTANASNTLTTNKPTGNEIDSISLAAGGGRVMGITPWNTKQVGAKGTISQATLGKKYLTKDLYDPELGDIKVGTRKMIDSGIGRYVYAVFKKPLAADANWSANKPGAFYNIAYTIKKEGTDSYITKIVGDYDKESCYTDKANCPDTLIGSSSTVLKDGDIQSSSDTNVANQGIPYPVANY